MLRELPPHSNETRRAGVSDADGGQRGRCARRVRRRRRASGARVRAREQPAPILDTIRVFAADLHLVDGQIGDAGKQGARPSCALILRALRESGGDAQAVSEEAIRAGTLELSRATGVDAAPEGGCALAVVAELARAARPPRVAEVIVFNTGSGSSYRF